MISSGVAKRNRPSWVGRNSKLVAALDQSRVAFGCPVFAFKKTVRNRIGPERFNEFPIRVFGRFPGLTNVSPSESLGDEEPYDRREVLDVVVDQKGEEVQAKSPQVLEVEHS